MPEASKRGACLGTPTAFTTTTRLSEGNFEWGGAVGSVMVGAVFLTASFAKRSG